MRLLIIIWIFVLILLMPAVFSVNATTWIYDNYVVGLWHFDLNLTEESSIYSNLANVTGNPVLDTTDKLVGNASYDSDGTDDIMFSKSIPEWETVSIMDRFTVCAWFKPDGTADNLEFIFTRADDGDAENHFNMMWDDRPGQKHIRWQIGDTVTSASATGITESQIEDGNYHFICGVKNQTGSTDKVILYYDGGEIASNTMSNWPASTVTFAMSIGGRGDKGGLSQGNIDELVYFNESLNQDNITYLNNTGIGIFLEPDPVSNPTPPEIDPNSYNLTSDGGEGCIKWRTDKNDPCTTWDTTPTISFTTDENAWCAIGIQDINYTNYTALPVDRDCTIGQDTLSHTCTLVPEDQLTEEISYIYISCKDNDNNQNITSSSGGLKVLIYPSDFERYGRNSIETGVQLALTSGYTIYTDQRIYARNSANNQSTGIFDKVVKWMNKIWAFNFITGNDTNVNMFNITPVLYTLEMNNITNSTINTTVYNFIIDTK